MRHLLLPFTPRYILLTIAAAGTVVFAVLGFAYADDFPPVVLPLQALGELIAAAGLGHPRELRPYHFMRRTGPDRIVSFTELYRFMEPGELLSGTTHPSLKEAWDVATPESFAPLGQSGPANIMLAAE